MGNDPSQWLVKSSSRILGPFPKSKIAEMLKGRELALLDEASRPLRRWQSIQYHPEFADLVEELRKLSVSDQTEVSWTPTSTSGLTQTFTDLQDGELTEEITDVLSGFTQTKEIVIDNLPEQKDAKASPAMGRYQSQGVQQNMAIQKKAAGTTKWLWVLTSLVLVAAFAFVLKKKLDHKTNRPQSAADLRESLTDDINVGAYRDALGLLKSFYPDPLKSGDFENYYGPLLIQLDGQTTLGRRVMEQISQHSGGQSKQADTGLGLADLIDGNLNGARKNFEHALQLDPAYAPALNNLGVVYLSQGDYKLARSYALKAISSRPSEGEPYILFGEASVYLYRSDNNKQHLSEALDHFSDFRRHSSDYGPQIVFYKMYLDWLRADRHLKEEDLVRFLDTDPQLTKDHRHNIFMYKGRTQWGILGGFCSQIIDQATGHPHILNLKAVCEADAGRGATSKSSIEQAMDQSPKDALVQAWYSYILNLNGLGDQSSVALGRANEFNRHGQYEMPFLFQARFCQQAGDWECARKNWQKLMEGNDNLISAMGGLATVYAAKGSHNEAKDFIDRGLKLSADYIPLLKLQLKGRKAGWY